MIILTDKGRICVFKLSDFNHILSDSHWDESQIKTKLECKEHKIDFVNACHTYALSKYLIKQNDTFRIAAACGKKLLIIDVKNNVCNSCASVKMSQNASNSNNTNNVTTLSTSNQSNEANEKREDNIINDFYLKKEITLSDVPQLINIVDTFTSEHYILVGYKNKCELLSERSGESLRQFQFNSLSTIRSIVELYDNNKLELLATHNCNSTLLQIEITSTSLFCKLINFIKDTSEFFKMDETCHTSSTIQSPSAVKSYFRFQWNSEPNHIICIFPYVIGLSNQSIEIRLLVNGNLVNNITMSNIKLIANKVSDLNYI